MSAAKFSSQSVDKLPSNILAKIDEVELRDPLERLIACLNDDSEKEDKHRELLAALVEYIMSSLAKVTGPLVTRSFQNLQNQVNHVAQLAEGRDWHNFEQGIPDLLRELIVLPSVQPEYSVQAAQDLNRALGDARTQLSDTKNKLVGSAAKIETSFQQHATSQKAKLSTESSRILQEFKEVEEQASAQHATTTAEMTRLLEQLKERYGFTATQVLGGAHELAAQSEEREASRHDTISQRSMWAAVAIAAVAHASWYAGWTPDWTGWFDLLRSLPLIGSPVVILLFVAKREGRVAAEHRLRHERLRSLALQFKSWEPYLNTLSEDVRAEMEKQVTPRLFVGDPGSSEPSGQ